jgi:hypothetical protein
MQESNVLTNVLLGERVKKCKAISRREGENENKGGEARARRGPDLFVFLVRL